MSYSLRKILALATFFTVLTISPIMVAGHLGPTVTCYSLTQPVTVDGKWTSTSEWKDAQETQLFVANGTAIGYFRVKHDGTWLYVLAESLIDTSVEYNDFMQIFLDTLHNDGKSPATDDYRFFAYYINATCTGVVTLKGDGQYWRETSPVEGVQAKINLDTGNSPHPPYPHVTGEIRIPLNIIGTGTFGFFIRFGDSSVFVSETYESLSKFFYWPGPLAGDQSKDPSTWGDVSYSDSSYTEAPPGGILGFPWEAIIVGLAMVVVVIVIVLLAKRGVLRIIRRT